MECRAALAEVPSDCRCATGKYGMAASASPPSINFREFIVISFVQGGSTLKKTALQFDMFRHKRLKRDAIERDSNVDVLHDCSPQSNPRFKTISLAERKIAEILVAASSRKDFPQALLSIRIRKLPPHEKNPPVGIRLHVLARASRRADCHRHLELHGS